MTSLICRRLIIVLGLGLIGAFCSTASAALLVDFKSLPISSTLPELKWTGTSLLAAPDAGGSQGNGDGLSPIGTQTVGGLIIETPLTVVDVAHGSTAHPSNNGSTMFTDVTLVLDTLTASGPAVEFSNLVSQPLSNGSFKLKSTDPAGALTESDLLFGTITSANITGIKNSDSGSVLSSEITYTGGLILEALNRALGRPLNTPVPGGSLTFSMLDLDSPLSIGTSGRLNAFTANANGQFGTPVVPEPASISLLVLGACGICVRRRIKH